MEERITEGTSMERDESTQSKSAVVSKPSSCPVACPFLLLLGLIMISVYLTALLAAVLNAISEVFISSSAEQFQIAGTHEVGWKTFTSIIFSPNIYFLYALAGSCLALIAVHLVNNGKWNRLIGPIKALAVLIMVLSLSGIPVLLLVEESYYSPGKDIDMVFSLLLQLAAFLAIFVLESPSIRRKLKIYISRWDRKPDLPDGESDLPPDL